MPREHLIHSVTFRLRLLWKPGSSSPTLFIQQCWWRGRARAHTGSPATQLVTTRQVHKASGSALVLTGLRRLLWEQMHDDAILLQQTWDDPGARIFHRELETPVTSPDHGFSFGGPMGQVFFFYLCKMSSTDPVVSQWSELRFFF